MIYADNFFLEVENHSLQEFGIDSLINVQKRINHFFTGLKRSDIEATKNQASQAEMALRRAGFNIEKIQKAVEHAALPVAQRMKSLKENSSSAEVRGAELSDVVAQSFSECFLTIYNDLSNDGEFTAGLKIFLAVLVAQMFISTLLSALIIGIGGVSVTSFVLAQVLAVVAVAPITEEYGRRYAIQQGEGLSSYLLILNTWEFVTYVKAMVQGGVGIGKAIGIRLLLAFFHQFLSALQKYGYLEDIDAGMDPDEAGHNSFILATVIHGLWNGTAVMQSVFNTAR